MILVDSQEAPLLDDELPTGVESIVQVSEEQAEAGRGLLFQQVAFTTSCLDKNQCESGNYAPLCSHQRNYLVEIYLLYK